jgi:hypothetical protein
MRQKHVISRGYRIHRQNLSHFFQDSSTQRPRNTSSLTLLWTRGLHQSFVEGKRIYNNHSNNSSRWSENPPRNYVNHREVTSCTCMERRAGTTCMRDLTLYSEKKIVLTREAWLAKILLLRGLQQ